VHSLFEEFASCFNDADTIFIAPIVKRLARPGDYVICLGAGSITQWAYALPGELAAGERAA
jgi:UDP-N-acetylmuramate-alanine ligase